MPQWPGLLRDTAAQLTCCIQGQSIRLLSPEEFSLRDRRNLWLLFIQLDHWRRWCCSTNHSWHSSIITWYHNNNNSQCACRESNVFPSKDGQLTTAAITASTTTIRTNRRSYTALLLLLCHQLSCSLKGARWWSASVTARCFSRLMTIADSNRRRAKRSQHSQEMDGEPRQTGVRRRAGAE